MPSTMAAPYTERDSKADLSADLRPVLRALLRDTSRAVASAPRGARGPQLHTLGADLQREDARPITLERYLRWVIGCVKCGTDAMGIAEVWGDMLGAIAATVLPLRDASLAETLTQCQEDPKQEVAVREDASLADIEAALAAARAHRRAEDQYIRALVHRRLDLLRTREVV